MRYCIHELIHIILVFLDDLTARSQKHSRHLDDLRQVFLWCRKYNICLNPIKCVFCVPSGHLHGLSVSHKWIVVNPLTVQAILNLPSPRTFRQLHSLQGKANFLRHFILDYATKFHSFLRLIHTNIPFLWDKHAQGAFDALKQSLVSSPLLSPTNFAMDFIL